MSDSDIEVIPNPNMKPSQPSDLCNQDLPAIFWDEMPENAEDNPDMAAINSILEESTPEERALNFKDMGNRALKTGLQQKKKFYIHQAVEQYTEGINLSSADFDLNSILYSNRAQANLLLGNNRNAMADGKDAIRYDANNIKGYFRAAKGAYGIYLWGKCRELCQKGLEIEPDNAELIKLYADALAAEEKRKKAVQEEEERNFKKRGPAREIATILFERGWKIGRPQFTVGNRRPRIEHGEVRWPVLFFYPEASMQNDAVEDFGEYDTFEAHFDVMYGKESPPLDWDTQKHYTRKNIEVYFLTHAAKPIDKDALTEALYGGWPSVGDNGPQRYGAQASEFVKVDEKLTLGDILSRRDFVVPGVPVFFVLAMDTPFKQQFINAEIPLL